MTDTSKQFVSVYLGFPEGATDEQLSEVNSELVSHGWDQASALPHAFTRVHEGYTPEGGIQRAVEMSLTGVAWKAFIPRISYVLQVGNSAPTGGQIRGADAD